MSALRRSGRLLAQFNAAQDEEVPAPRAGRGRGGRAARGRHRGCGRGNPGRGGRGEVEAHQEDQGEEQAEGQQGEAEQQQQPQQQQQQPPPPPPNLVEVMATQTRLMEVLANAMQQNMQRGQRGPPEETLSRKIESFHKLHPPTFDHSSDPLDADDWLRKVEKKLDLTTCDDFECVTLATHKLVGTARAW
ncbi:unnamed protein product [Urochloa humidicola]